MFTGGKGPKRWLAPPSLSYHMAQRFAVTMLESRGSHTWNGTTMQTRMLKMPRARDRWMPNNGDRYFIVLGDGTIKTFWWNGTDFDQKAWQFGNCFRVWKDAVQAREAVKDCCCMLTGSRRNPCDTPSNDPCVRTSDTSHWYVFGIFTPDRENLYAVTPGRHLCNTLRYVHRVQVTVQGQVHDRIEGPNDVQIKILRLFGR